MYQLHGLDCTSLIKDFKSKSNVSTPTFSNCGVPQGFILVPLLFLLYVNDMSQAVDCELFLYAYDSLLLYQHRNIKAIDTKLN